MCCPATAPQHGAGPDGPVTVRPGRTRGVLEVGDLRVSVDPDAGRGGGGERGPLRGRDGGDDLVGLDRDADLLVGDLAERGGLGAEVVGDLLERRERAGDEVGLDLDRGRERRQRSTSSAAACVVTATCSTPDGGVEPGAAERRGVLERRGDDGLAGHLTDCGGAGRLGRDGRVDRAVRVDLGGDDRLVGRGRVGGEAASRRGRGRARHDDPSTLSAAAATSTRVVRERSPREMDVTMISPL